MKAEGCLSSVICTGWLTSPPRSDSPEEDYHQSKIKFSVLLTSVFLNFVVLQVLVELELLLARCEDGDVSVLELHES